MSINALELKAGLFGLQSLLPSTCRHVRMMMDNTTAVACVNKMGTSHSKHCNMIPNKFGISVLKRESGYRLHTYQVERTLMRISNLGK